MDYSYVQKHSNFEVGPNVARILVVDDEPDVRELFNITLKMVGHVTDTARDGVEAVDKVKESMPDLILLDLMMPRLDGFGFLAHMRHEYEQKPVRVLVATAKTLEEVDQEKLSSWPVVGVLNKGELDIGQMVGIVSTALVQNPLKDGSATAAATQDAKEAPEGAAGQQAAPQAVQEAPGVAAGAAEAEPVKPEPTSIEKKPEVAAEPAKQEQASASKQPLAGPAAKPGVNVADSAEEQIEKKPADKGGGSKRKTGRLAGGNPQKKPPAP